VEYYRLRRRPHQADSLAHNEAFGSKGHFLVCTLPYPGASDISTPADAQSAAAALGVGLPFTGRIRTAKRKSEDGGEFSECNPGVFQAMRNMRQIFWGRGRRRPPSSLLPRKEGENSKNCKCAHRKLSHCRGAPQRYVQIVCQHNQNSARKMHSAVLGGSGEIASAGVFVAMPTNCCREFPRGLQKASSSRPKPLRPIPHSMPTTRSVPGGLLSHRPK
jgi:hypothetical protein